MSVISNDKRFFVNVCIDKNRKKLTKFAEFWTIKKFWNDINFLSKFDIDLVIIAVDTESHFVILKKIIKLNIVFNL